MNKISRGFVSLEGCTPDESSGRVRYGMPVDPFPCQRVDLLPQGWVSFDTRLSPGCILYEDNTFLSARFCWLHFFWFVFRVFRSLYEIGFIILDKLLFFWIHIFVFLGYGSLHSSIGNNRAKPKRNGKDERHDFPCENGRRYTNGWYARWW